MLSMNVLKVNRRLSDDLDIRDESDKLTEFSRNNNDLKEKESLNIKKEEKIELKNIDKYLEEKEPIILIDDDDYSSLGEDEIGDEVNFGPDNLSKNEKTDKLTFK